MLRCCKVHEGLWLLSGGPMTLLGIRPVQKYYTVLMTAQQHLAADNLCIPELFRESKIFHINPLSGRIDKKTSYPTNVCQI